MIDIRSPGKRRRLRARPTGAACVISLRWAGDGTSYEIVNGLYPQALAGERPTLAFLPLGTGNSFLRDFSDQGVEYAIESLLAHRSRVLRCDAACDIATV